MPRELKPLGIKVLIVEPGQFRTELAGAGMRHMPEIDAYTESVAPIRQFARTMHGTQEGDRHKAARAIDLALKDGNTPLRLHLGRDAVDAIRSHADSMLRDLKRWEPVGVDTRIGE